MFYQGKNNHKTKNHNVEWLIIHIFIVSVVSLLLAGVGDILAYLFPLSAVIVGLFLYFRAPGFYVGFSLWITLLAPLVKRIIDYRSGYMTFGSPNLASSLVVLISGITFLQCLPTIQKRGGFPFLLSFIGVFYSCFVGLIKNPLRSVMLSSISWLSPIFLGFYLFVNWRRYPSMKGVFQKTFVWATLILGIYGVLQHLLAPPWDVFYMENIEALSFGTPEPLGIRPFGTLDAPQTYASSINMGLLLLLTCRGSLRFMSAGLGHLGLLLSSARSAWVAYLFGLFLLVPSLKSSQQLRLFGSLTIIVLIVLQIASAEPFASRIESRIESFESINEDSSLQGRTAAYNQLVVIAMSQYFGFGMGGGFVHPVLGSADNGLLTAMFSLGWLGLTPYLCGLLMILLAIFQPSNHTSDPFIGTTRIVALSMLSQVLLNVVTAGSMGLWLWSSLGISLAGRTYLSNMNLVSYSN